MGAIFGSGFSDIEAQELSFPQPLQVNIQSPAVLAYHAIEYRVSQGASPLSFEILLHHCDVASHGDIVDTTNLIMTEI